MGTHSICVSLLELPHRGDSNGFTQYTIFNIKITLNYPKSAAQLWDFFPRDSRTSSEQRYLTSHQCSRHLDLLYKYVCNSYHSKLLSPTG